MCPLPLEMGDTLTEREIEEKFDQADQIAAAPTSMTVENILARIDAEGRPAFAVQRTQADELLAGAGAVNCPVVPLQVLQQRNSLFELPHILAHGLFLPPAFEHRDAAGTFPGEDGGRLAGVQRRRGQHWHKNGNRVRRLSLRAPCWSVFPLPSHWPIVCTARCKNAKAGCAESS
jgi:hypothetical protein